MLLLLVYGQLDSAGNYFTVIFSSSQALLSVSYWIDQGHAPFLTFNFLSSARIHFRKSKTTIKHNMDARRQYSAELKFDELPDPKRVWAGNPGSREEGLGRLVLLTSERTRDAAKEIETGQRVGLNWDLRKLEYPGYGRISCGHQVVPLLDGIAFDDVYTINPRE